MRVHGTWNTVPIDTRTLRRYSGSAHRGVTSTASTPSAAQLRKIAPTLVWSTMSSRTATRRAPASSAATGRGSSGRCIDGERPAVHVEAGDLLDHRRIGDVHRHADRSASSTRSARSVSQRSPIR